ncbi:P-loop containing nucleoside triphosphate hydrolase protein [Podospora aff. communis PSN243]|uniref:P-loop containing nucleoside triphosphate hydrolase protein n=1 Tax=Podospora aff. communis PSN243 TaxID=3040156 RepID=A0AAV9GEW0_9PEZI|nr:P-loop containing nucleoside triphosphate hydrolase protein [Podospora aff. communis PSN243]
MNVDLDSSAMQQLQAEQRALLDVIDDLRGLGLGKFLDLPQLIVVGEQSSGKSSVLEAISRVHFPIKDGICTRFPTELVLRRSAKTTVDVTVQNDERQTKLDSFRQSSFAKADLPRVIEEAKKHMGVSADSGPSDFSESVLRVEVSGPDLPQLTLVDLPGFYHNETESQSIEGIEVVNRLCEKYMRQENSIILAVVSAQSETAGHKVLREAKKHDPARIRTLGIITKPDKLDEGSDSEQAYLRLAQNKDNTQKLGLGWHVLRNRAFKEAGSADSERDEEEKRFFQSGVWSTLSFQDRGVETLRDKLSHVLLSHVQRKLPSLVDKIGDHIKSHQFQLRNLGDQRSSPKQVRKFLINISSRFQRLALEAIQGNYFDDDFFGGLYPDCTTTSYTDWRVRKLRALVRDMNRAFYHVLSKHGARRTILWKESDDDGDENDEDPSGSEEAPLNGQEDEGKQYLGPLINLYDLEAETFVSVKDLKKELQHMASENQGVEFPGSTNDRVTLRLFRDQAQPWKDLAQQHINLVTNFGRTFAEQLVVHLVSPDSKTADSLLRTYINPYFDQKNRDLHTKLAELLQHYQSGYDPQPLHEDFSSIADGLRNDRLVNRLSDRLFRDHPDLFVSSEKSKNKLTRDALAQAILSVSASLKSDFSVDRIIDNMSAYYELSLKTFTNNIMILALENCLLSGIPEILTADKIHDLSDDEVTALAAESKHIMAEREKLDNELRRLYKGFEACKQYRPRGSVELAQGQSAKPVLSEPSSTDFKQNTTTPTPSKAPAHGPPPTAASTPGAKSIFANLDTNTSNGVSLFGLPTQPSQASSQSKSPSSGSGFTSSTNSRPSIFGGSVPPAGQPPLRLQSAGSQTTVNWPAGPVFGTGTSGSQSRANGATPAKPIFSQPTSLIPSSSPPGETKVEGQNGISRNR